MERGETFLEGVVINVQGREAGHQLRGSNGSGKEMTVDWQEVDVNAE